MPLFVLLLLTADYQPQTLAVPPFEHTFGFYRASKYYLQLFLGPSFEYRDPQGIDAVKLKELNNPKTMRDDDELSAFAVNSGAGQIIYNVGLEAVKSYGNTKTFNLPKGIAVNPDGSIAVADFGNRRIVKLRYEKGDLIWLKEIPLGGRPFDVAFDSKGNLYATDFDQSRVLVFGPDDSPLSSFGVTGRGEGEIYQPMGIDVLDAEAPDNFYHEDFLAIVDNDGRRVSKFTRQGRFLGAQHNSDIGLADSRFQYVAIDYYGSIYVTDEINDQIHKFDRNLGYVISEGRSGTSRGEFSSPRGISISRRFGQVFLSEREGGQYLWIASDAFFVGCFPAAFTAQQPGTTAALYITDESVLNVAIYNRMGDKIRDMIQNIKRPAGEFLLIWDGRDSNGELVPPGEYEFRVNVNTVHGHGRRVKKIVKGSVKCIAS